MKYTHLTYEERRNIAKMLKFKMSLREIAVELGRSPSTISREIKRNSSISNDSNLIYKFVNADERYRSRIPTRRTGKYEKTLLSKYVYNQLLQTWSPEQISYRIRIDYPDDNIMRVSYSTIYRWLRKGLLEKATTIKLRRYKRKY